MKRTVAALLIGMWILAVPAYGANGDLIVDGKLGVGPTNPGLYRLWVAGALRSDGVGSGTSWSFGGNGDFAVDAPSVAGGRFIVKDVTGNIGIGTSTPSARLTLYDSSSFNPASTALNSVNIGHVHANSGWDATGICSGNSTGGSQSCFAANIGYWFFGSQSDANNMANT